MIKFFRDTRKALVSDGNTGKYLKYAIGEILLVVVGILIALQVSNWNANVQLDKKELTFLSQIDTDLENIASDMHADYISLKLGERSHFRITDYINNNSSFKDSMCFDFYWLMKDEYIYPIKSTYDAIKEEGLSIIKNDSIRQGIQAAYENIFPRISKANPFFPDLEEFFSSYYQKNFKINKDTSLVMNEQFPYYQIKYPYQKNVNGKTYPITVGFIPKNFEDFKKDDSFQVLMRQAYIYRSYKISRYRGGKEYIEKLRGIIARELKRRNK